MILIMSLISVIHSKILASLLIIQSSYLDHTLINEKKTTVSSDLILKVKSSKKKKNTHCEHVLVIKRRQAASPVKSDFCEII